MEQKKESVRKLFLDSGRFRWYLLFAVTATFIVVLYPNLVITQPTYRIGDVADRDIKAPQDFLIEDRSATAENRRRAVEEVLTLYDHDRGLATALNKRVYSAFADLQKPMETDREAPVPPPEEAVGIPTPATLSAIDPAGLQERKTQLKEKFEETIGFEVSDGAFKILYETPAAAEIADTIVRILTDILENGVVTSKAILLKESEKGIVLRDVETKQERVVTDLKQFYGLDQAQNRVRSIGQPLLKDINYNLKNLIVDFVQQLIQPNVTLNRSETEERKKHAAEEIKPILYKIKAGEMLLREGERVTDVQMLKLNALQSQMSEENVLTGSAGAALLMICLLVSIFVLNRPRIGRSTREQNKNLLLITMVLITFFFIAQLGAFLNESLALHQSSEMAANSLIYGLPLAAGAMIICLFLGFELAVAFAVVLAICVTVVLQLDFNLFLYFLISSAMAAYWIRDCRERKVFIKAGAKLGLLNIVLATAVEIYSGRFGGAELLWAWAFAFMGGIGAGIVTAGIIPLVEITFDYTTDIKLLELANLDQPILRNLMMEAPGTYHHSVIVGSMVEGAAAEIGANPLLAKVCGYYHDIGKIKKPMYFIENQTNGKNKHDKLAPSMSSLILVAHVKDGIDIAKKHRLGQSIIDTIQQHHGTSLIRYFYDKAIQQKGEDAVKIDHFRYPGPRPQTREIALVMLADIAEAASRTLANPTPSRIQGLVQNLINKVFSDGQLDNCELTLKDLHKIAKSFNKILNAIHHHRVEYPEKTTGTHEKIKNGSANRQQAKKIPDGLSGYPEFFLPVVD
jgi:hypothetical protein